MYGHWTVNLLVMNDELLLWLISLTMMMTPIMTKVAAETTWKDLRIFIFGVFATQVTNLVSTSQSDQSWNRSQFGQFKLWNLSLQ